MQGERLFLYTKGGATRSASHVSLKLLTAAQNSCNGHKKVYKCSDVEL